MLIPRYAPDPESATFRVYSKAKRSQWDPEGDIDWSLPHELNPMLAKESRGLARIVEQYDLSQSFYGEQAGAAFAGSMLRMAPDIEARLFLTSQVYDEGRHVEALGRFLERLGGVHPRCNRELAELYEEVHHTDIYEAKLVGMHVILEGAALASYRGMQKRTTSPLFRALLARIISDELRHTGFAEAQLRSGAADRSPALRKQLEDLVTRWWKIYAAAYATDDPELKKLLPQRIRSAMDGALGQRLADLRAIQRDVSNRLRRCGLTLRADPVDVQAMQPIG